MEYLQAWDQNNILEKQGSTYHQEWDEILGEFPSHVYHSFHGAGICGSGAE